MLFLACPCGGELLELRLLDTRLLDTFLTKSTARHKKRNCSNRLNRFFEQFHFLRADEQLLDTRVLDTTHNCLT